MTSLVQMKTNRLRQFVTLLSLCFLAFARFAFTAEVIQQLGVDRGICVVLGDNDCEQALQIARATKLTVYVQLEDSNVVLSARDKVYKTGLLGSRVYIGHGQFERIHLADNLADTVVVDRSIKVNQELREEAMRVLRPHGKLVAGDETFSKPTEVGTDDWGHPYHGPDNNPQSNDRSARGPYLTHFMSDPWYATMPQMTVISGGRIFKVFGNRASAQPQWPVMNTMMCMSAYNGAILWKRELNPDFMLHRSTFIASPDTLYFADDESCKLIDPTNGKVTDEIVVADDIADGKVWKWMALVDGVLFALVGEEEPAAESNKGERYRGAGWPWWKIGNYKFGFGRTILAIDTKTKKTIWSHREEDPLDSRAMCMTDDKIYFYSHQKYLGCVDAKNGNLVWRSSDKQMLSAVGEHDAAQHWMKGFASTAYVKCSDDALYFAGPTRTNIAAVSAKDGKLLWKRPGGNSQLVLRSDGVYALGEGTRNGAESSFKLELLTGKVLDTFPSRDRCTRATGCVDSIFTRGGRGGSTAAFNVTSGETTMSTIGPMRPACQDGVVVAHGQLYWGPWKCRCDGTQIGVICLEAGRDFDYESKATEAERLVRTSIESKSDDSGVGVNDWPAYRKDNSRSTRSTFSTANEPKLKWTFSPKAPNVATAPIAIADTVFLGGSDGVVRALDSKSGEVKWTSFTGGAMKYPPAAHDGRLFAGSGDGWIYSLDMGQGQEVWRFRAAPIERKIPVYGSLLSTWPVGGGVVVQDGVVYAAAGMVNYDGTHVYALDAETGSIVWHNNTAGHLGINAPDSGAGVQSHLLLHGDSIYMSGGGQAPMVAFNVQDGKCSRKGSGRGKDLFVFKNQVRATGNPLYWRPEDSHYIMSAVLDSSAGHISIAEPGQVSLVGDKTDDKGKPIAVWSRKPIQEINAAAITSDTLLIAGVTRQMNDDNWHTNAELIALNLTDGKPIWRKPLPAEPVSWGIAINQSSEIVVSLQNGQVVCFSNETVQ